MFTIEARTVIDASPSTVWAVLMDFAKYHEWSTMLIPEQLEAPVLGQPIKLRLSAPDGPAYSFAPEVIKLDANSHFAWRQKTGISGVFDGEHHFVLTALDTGGTHLHNYEHYSGLLSPIMKRLPMMQNAPQGFQQINAEIKHRAESI